jgi:hypothetical protein
MGLLSLLVAALPATRFEYRAPELDASCPSAGEVQQRVATRLGQAPFDDAANRRVRVTIHRSPQGFAAQIELEEPGAPPARRLLSSRSCRELADSVALVVALTLDPLAAPQPPKLPPPPIEAPPPPPPPVVLPAAPPSAWSGELWIGPSAALGSTPAAAFGARLGGALLFRQAWALGLEAGAAAAPRASTDFGAYTPLVADGRLLACGRWGVASACLEGGVGTFMARGGQVTGGASTVPTAFVGARAGATWRLGAGLAVRTELEAVAPLLRAAVESGSNVVWRASAASGSLLLALVWRR